MRAEASLSPADRRAHDAYRIAIVWFFVPLVMAVPAGIALIRALRDSDGRTRRGARWLRWATAWSVLGTITTGTFVYWMARSLS